MSLGRPFEDGELIGKPPRQTIHTPRLPPATSTSAPKRGHTTLLTGHFKMAAHAYVHAVIDLLAPRAMPCSALPCSLPALPRAPLPDPVAMITCVSATLVMICGFRRQRRLRVGLCQLTVVPG